MGRPGDLHLRVQLVLWCLSASLPNSAPTALDLLVFRGGSVHRGLSKAMGPPSMQPWTSCYLR